MEKFLLVGVGGFVGAIARFGLHSWVYGRFLIGLPFGTLIVNTLGCLFAGVLVGFFKDLRGVYPNVHFLVLVGFFGSFTTFSAFGLETVELLRDGRIGLGIGNVIFSIAASLLGVWIGWSVGTLIAK